MFKAQLKTKLKAIFDLEKVTFDHPSESKEQECAFIQIDVARNHIKDGQALSMVTGKLTVFANSDKLPYGYFSKQIAKAPVNDTLDFFFYDIEKNKGQYQNIVERDVSFIYFFNSQYDPDIGTIESITLTEET